MMEIDDRRFSRLALIGVILGFLLLITALVAVVLTLVINQRSSAMVTHTYEVVDELKQLELLIERAETASRGYLIAPDPARLKTYQFNASNIPPATERLARLTSDNPVERANIQRLRPLIKSELDTLARIIGQATGGQLDAARATFKIEVAQQRVNRVRNVTGAMRDEEQSLLSKRTAETQRLASALFVILGITALLLLVFGVAVIIIVRRYTESLVATRDRLNVLNTDLEGAVAERTSDLQRANDEIQRFAYIVSHDLRSPLVNVLGFTAELEETNKALGALIERAEKEAPQLITEDARNARDDLPEAIGFIRSSTQKMDRLINAILKLSREGRRTLTPEPLDMGALFDGIAGSLMHRLGETGTTLTIETPVPDIVADRIAIEQIFSNLIENGVKYLQPGRAGVVKVRGWEKGDRVFYEVQDNGRGIDPKDHERVFDLFRRSGTQDQPGEGIGLAHVRALAYRLGGFVDLKSQLGEGATFQVNLPKTYADEGAAN